jgi:positive regulator of sigma E activity
MTADAVVVAARADGRIDLEFQAKPCSGCAGTCLWRRLQATRIELMRAGKALAPGTEVTVALPESRVLLASLLLHGMPLAAILAGAAAGAALTASDTGTLLGAVTGLAIAFLMFRRLGRRLERATLSQLQILPKP